tara:strand:- start:424 stop:822 length:399 start_codon:yes stop_codon:yes gene_type:complete
MISFKLTTPKVNLDWWKSSKSKLTKLVEDYNRQSWSAEKDPVTGSGWAPRKQPTGGWPLLRKSGKMQDSTRFSAAAGTMLFTAKTSVNYGGFHMSGTSKMPQRRWLGIGSPVIPEMEREIAKHIFKGRVTYS